MPRKILIADDEQHILDTLGAYLRQDGFDVLACRNGREALAAFRREQPDLVILDVMMPEMDGWQVLRTLKGDERTRKVPVVMLSARAERRDKMIGLQEGAEGYIAKPFSPAEVVREVQSFLERGT